MSIRRGEVTGVHLLEHPRIPQARHTSAHWTQAERDRFVATGVAPAQPSVFDNAGEAA